jgi:ABC-2 type transport system ATP-binding protein
VLFSSHITSDLEKVADYVTFIHEGQIVFNSSKDELIYKCGILKCSAADFSKLDKSGLVRWRKGECGYEALITDRESAKRKYPHFLIDTATIDEIMLFYVKGEQ